MAQLETTRKIFRYALIDLACGFIWADSRHLGGDTPIDLAKLCDADVGEVPHEYGDVGAGYGGATYAVYSLPDEFPAIDDGQDEEIIARVTGEGAFVTHLRRIESNV
jgi:hypothetical protein